VGLRDHFIGFIEGTGEPYGYYVRELQCLGYVWGKHHLPLPAVTDPEVLPMRPQRHVLNSIATVRRHLTVALARRICLLLPFIIIRRRETNEA
jgi:hypothetical protein